MECNFAKNGLRIVRGNAFTLRIVVKAYRTDGSEVSGFVLDPTTDVLLMTTSTGVRPIPFTVEDGSTNHAIVSFGGGLQVGYYGLDFSGVFSGEDWRFAAKNVFSIVELTAQGNVPKDGIVTEDTYDVVAGVSLSLLGPQADWAETDPTKQSYIKNKPVIYTKAEIDVLLAAEVQARQQADGVLDGKIADEMARAKAAEKVNADDIDAIEAKIPSGASSSNKLVDNQTMTNGLAQKQNIINDLQTIREGAAAGALAAPQSTTYTKTEVDGLVGDEETRAKAAEKANADDIDAIEEKIPAAASSSNKLVDNQTMTNGLSQKQDTINDLQTIREGAAKGATSEQVVNKVTTIDENSTDAKYPSAKAVYDFVKDETGKARETVVITATANKGSGAESAVITVKIDNVVVATGTETLTLAIEYGKQYVVECSRVYDYLTPAAQTFTAGQSVRNITCAYTYIERDTITLDQTETDELSMITGDVQGDVIKAIRAASHLYIGTQTETGNQLICQLKDDDGTKYADGTTAAMDGTEGDQWLKLPVFWWKVIPVGTAASDGSYDSYSFAFAFAGEPDPSWHKWEGDKNLLGAKKMYVTGGKGYSRSGIQGSANFTQAQGNDYATARGTGYLCVTWEWQWMMCILFYAWYGRMNSQAQCGSGSNSNTRTLGTKDSLGMTDTTSSNGNADNTKFWGIENWWGDLSEWIGNITSNNYVVTITDMNTGQSRQVSGWYQFEGTGGYASRFKVTQQLDFIPRAKNGTETTCYCDWVNGNTGSRVVSRSYSNASAYGGVAYVGSKFAPSYTGARIGSRLAFNGVVTEAESVAAYKAALPAGQ